MICKLIFALLLFTVAFLVVAPMATASTDAMGEFNQQYGTNDTRLERCTTCHGSDAGSLNPYGLAYQENGGDFAAIESLDSDDDGFNNLDEINALAFPGDPEDNPGNAPAVPVGVVENVSERVSNAAEKVGNVTEKVSNVTEKISDVTGEQPETEEAATETEQQSPGFEVTFAALGILISIYLLKRK